ncbi:MAG: hypothetical protein ACFE9Z_08725 [Promethearchaeota archaeon]
MDILFEVIRYVLYIIIGTFLIKWYSYKKGWEKSIIISLLFTIFWKVIIFNLILVLTLLIEFFLGFNLSNPAESYGISLILMMISFVLNISIGLLLFSKLFKQKIHESIVIILTIAIIELLTENILFYSIILPFILAI